MKKGSHEMFLITLTVFITVIVWVVVEIYLQNSKKRFSANYQNSAQVVIKQIPLEQAKKLLRER